MEQVHIPDPYYQQLPDLLHIARPFYGGKLDPLRSERLRLSTFYSYVTGTKRFLSFYITPEELAKAGFVYTGKSFLTKMC